MSSQATLAHQSLPATTWWERLRLETSTRRATVSILVVAIVWEVGARWVNNRLFVAPLSSVVARTASLWQAGQLQPHIWTSLQEFAVGFAIAATVGILFGAAMAHSERVRDYADPWVSMLYSTPLIALGPLFILWLGIGIQSKVAVIFLVAVFPILINTFTGLANTDRNLIEVARSFGASSAQVYRKVRFPSAVPFIMAGLRLGVARALVGVVAAELFGARAGLGYLIIVSAQTFDTAGVFAGVLIFAVGGVISVELIKRLERRLAPWRYHIAET